MFNCDLKPEFRKYVLAILRVLNCFKMRKKKETASKGNEIRSIVLLSINETIFPQMEVFCTFAKKGVKYSLQKIFVKGGSYKISCFCLRVEG
jgi:hypothetical protein